MRATRGSWTVRGAGALLALGFVLVAPRIASAGGTRRAPSRAVEPSSEASAVINGTVVDVDGKAMAGVTVLATRAKPDGRVHPRVESDRDGKFHFALPPGEYVFVALHRNLAGLTPAMRVLRELEVVLVVAAPTGAA
jgi:hypothetical protein